MQKPKQKKPRNLLFFEPNTLAQTWSAERRSKDTLPKYYSDRGVFQAFRARAGSSSPILQHSWAMFPGKANYL